jgi:hypothetical protein
VFTLSFGTRLYTNASDKSFGTLLPVRVLVRRNAQSMLRICLSFSGNGELRKMQSHGSQQVFRNSLR